MRFNFNKIKYIALFIKYFNLINSLINFLMMLWILPLDYNNYLDLLINLIDTEEGNKEKAKWLLKKVFSLCMFTLMLYIIYKGTGPDGTEEYNIVDDPIN